MSSIYLHSVYIYIVCVYIYLVYIYSIYIYSIYIHSIYIVYISKYRNEKVKLNPILLSYTLTHLIAGSKQKMIGS